MLPEFEKELNNNLKFVQNQIDSNKGPQEVCLVAVSKLKPAEYIQSLYEQSHHLHFGENYVQELFEKSQKLPQEIKWHFIGHLQSNKCKQLASIPNLYVVETIDSEKLAATLNKACINRENRLKVFVQVNTSGEESKSGVEPQQCVELARYIHQQTDKLELAGLMTIGSANVTGEINPDFQLLKELGKEVQSTLGLKTLELSMGMSGDYVQAIKEGSTNVRVGSSIFGERTKS